MHRRLCRSPIAVIGAVVLFALLAVGVAACGAGSTTSTATGAPSTETTAAAVKTLTVSAASSLKAAFTEIGEAFDAANGSTTTFNFDGSGTLQRQIEGGAPVDVFAPAAQKHVTALKDAGLVDAATIKQFAGNGIVLVVPADSTLGLTTFEDLTAAGVENIGYGDPKAAAIGMPAEEILNHLGIFESVKPKVVYAANASQALEYVSTGEVDAGILFTTEAKAGGDEVKVVATADPSWYSTVSYPIAIVSDSKAKDLGEAFIEYVTGPAGQAILAEYGFLPPPTSE